MHCEQLAENFKSYFRIVYANTDQLLKHVYKIRYDVFCDELKLEENCPMDVEKDEFDAYSHHFLLQHISSGEYAGTIRYVLPQLNSRIQKLPFEINCAHAVDPEIVDLASLATGTYGEISRLAVPARFRKRSGERGKPYIVGSPQATADANEKRLFPYISVGLYLISAAFHLHRNLDIAFVMVEPRLARGMKRIGIQLDQVGDIIEYHGQRAPFCIREEKFFAHLKPEIRPLYEYISAEVSGQLDSPTHAAPAQIAV